MSLNNNSKDSTLHNADTGIEASMKTRITPAQQQLEDVFTFVTVYYKHGEWGTNVFDTLREGLLKFVDSTAKSEREGLVLLNDKELADRLLKIGTERIDNQIGYGLVGIIKGPRYKTTRSPTVYLEMYYKHGEWELREGHSRLLDDAMERVEREMGEEEWDELDEDEQMEAALERSSQDVDEQRGWGVVETFPGKIYAIA